MIRNDMNDIYGMFRHLLIEQMIPLTALDVFIDLSNIFFI